jgi:hypothetical protein
MEIKIRVYICEYPGGEGYETWTDGEQTTL